MGKKKKTSVGEDAGPSKADAIRGYWEKLGNDARPKDIVNALKAEGIPPKSALCAPVAKPKRRLVAAKEPLPPPQRVARSVVSRPAWKFPFQHC